MHTPVRWGILGAANIAVKKVLPAMLQAQTVAVDAIASRRLERAEAAATRLGIPTAFGSYEELLADPTIEAVYIPLPNHLHPEWTLAAAEAGKHVLCEKPLAMTSTAAQEMVDFCSSARVKLMEAFMYRLHPMWAEVRRLVDSGLIGEVRSISAVFSYYNVDATDIRNKVEFGGGALYDIGCYCVNAARMIFGAEPARVKSSIRRDDRFGTDVITSAILDFGGRHAIFTCSTQLESNQNVAIEGTEGRLVVEIPFNIPPDVPTRILHVAGGEPPVAPRVEIHEIGASNQYGIQAELFSKAIREDTPVPTPPEDAVANLRVIERIFADAAG
ncbi:MAG TPA: Gfo/Idh/MocA family oxidoreductase [Acidimicrobiia bacterium]|nr:Gfo/Idh/MocA family oxidoreductase [Acidimicrobiia bacterium]